MEGYRAKKLIKSKSGLKIVVANDEFKSPFIIQEPQWAPDSEITHCTKCCTKFGFTTRKHHCRRCGQIFCSKCCNLRMALPRMCFVDPVRVCVDCEPQTKFENAFFDRHIKTLVNGASFSLESDHCKLDPTQTTLCKLSLDHRFLLFDGALLEPIDINNITSLQVVKDNLSGDKSVNIEYSCNGESYSLRLGTNEKVQVRQESFLWIKAMQQAYNLLLQPT